MKAVIYNEGKSATQSGRNKSKYWALEYVDNFEERDNKNIMKWVSSSYNSMAQLRIRFKTLEEAIKYANQKKLNYELVDAKERKIVPKSYASNFLK